MHGTVNIKFVNIISVVLAGFNLETCTPWGWYIFYWNMSQYCLCYLYVFGMVQLVGFINEYIGPKSTVDNFQIVKHRVVHNICYDSVSLSNSVQCFCQRTVATDLLARCDNGRIASNTRSCAMSNASKFVVYARLDPCSLYPQCNCLLGTFSTQIDGWEETVWFYGLLIRPISLLQT